MGLYTDLLGMIFLPVLIILTFGMMTGAKVDGIISAMFSILAELVRGAVKVLLAILPIVFKLLTQLLSAGIKLLAPALQKATETAKKSRPKVKLVVNEEEENERK